MFSGMVSLSIKWLLIEFLTSKPVKETLAHLFYLVESLLLL